MGFQQSVRLVWRWGQSLENTLHSCGTDALEVVRRWRGVVLEGWMEEMCECLGGVGVRLI